MLAGARGNRAILPQPKGILLVEDRFYPSFERPLWLVGVTINPSHAGVGLALLTIETEKPSQRPKGE